MSQNQQSLRIGKAVPAIALTIQNQAHIIADMQPSILAQLKSIAAASHAANTRQSIDQEYAEIKHRCEQKFAPVDQWKSVSMTTDIVSEEMAKYLPEVEHLSHMPGGLELALELILHLGKRSLRC